MANQELLKILKNGSEDWNKFRKDKSETITIHKDGRRPLSLAYDLSRAVLQRGEP